MANRKARCTSRAKGKKGKSKHKVAYNYDFFVDVSQYEDISNENYLEETIYVMSLHDDRTVASQGVHMVTVDTGATESLCGANAMARILDTMNAPTYEVSLADRSIFRFGNGFSQRATSRVDLDTNALGRLSFYILDGEAENTLPLLGGREMKAYCGSYTLLIGILMALGRHMIFIISEDDTWPSM